MKQANDLRYNLTPLNYFVRIDSENEIWRFYKCDRKTNFYLIGKPSDPFKKFSIDYLEKTFCLLADINIGPLYAENLAYLIGKLYLGFCFNTALKSSAQVYPIINALLDMYRVRVPYDDIAQHIWGSKS